MTYFEFRVDDADGQRNGRRFSQDGKVELWVVARERTENPEHQAGRKILDGDTWREARVLSFPLAFDNYPIAQRAGGLLDGLLAAANERARRPDTHAELASLADLLAETRPEVDDGHEHKIVLERFSRALPMVATCRVCLHTFRELDVDAVRDLIGTGFPNEAERATLAERLESQINAEREGQ